MSFNPRVAGKRWEKSKDSSDPGSFLENSTYVVDLFVAASRVPYVAREPQAFPPGGPDVGEVGIQDVYLRTVLH